MLIIGAAVDVSTGLLGLVTLSLVTLARAFRELLNSGSRVPARARLPTSLVYLPPSGL